MDPKDNPQSLIEDTKDACLKFYYSIGLMFSTKRAMKERFDWKKRELKAARHKRGNTGEGGSGDVDLPSEMTEADDILDYLFFTQKLGNRASAKIEGAKQYCLGKKTKWPKVNVKLEPECITLESDDDPERTQDQTQGIDGNFSQQVADNFDQTQEDQNTYVPQWGHQRSDSVANEQGDLVYFIQVCGLGEEFA